MGLKHAQWEIHLHKSQNQSHPHLAASCKNNDYFIIVATLCINLWSYPAPRDRLSWRRPHICLRTMYIRTKSTTKSRTLSPSGSKPLPINAGNSLSPIYVPSNFGFGLLFIWFRYNFIFQRDKVDLRSDYKYDISITLKWFDTSVFDTLMCMFDNVTKAIVCRVTNVEYSVWVNEDQVFTLRTFEKPLPLKRFSILIPSLLKLRKYLEILVFWSVWLTNEICWDLWWLTEKWDVLARSGRNLFVATCASMHLFGLWWYRSKVKYEGLEFIFRQKYYLHWPWGENKSFVASKMFRPTLNTWRLTWDVYQCCHM